MALRIEGYDSVYSGPHLVLIRPGWRPHLLEDVLCGFENVPVADRTAIASGRISHFTYGPKDAPGRVLVRQMPRGGAASLAGNFNVHFGLRRVVRELKAVDRARKSGLHVPDIVACRATHILGPIYRLLLVVEELPGARNLLSIVDAITPRERRRIIAEVALEVRRMHEAGLYHGDLTVKNILLQRDEVFLIDFDRARIREQRTPSMDVSNLSRLNRSVEKVLLGRVSRTDRLRFLFGYAGGRDGVAELSRRCEAGMWRHRLWWAMTGAARS